MECSLPADNTLFSGHSLDVPDRIAFAQMGKGQRAMGNRQMGESALVAHASGDEPRRSAV
jgi:predicted GIY-YIG superfamily endonuclease